MTEPKHQGMRVEPIGRDAHGGPIYPIFWYESMLHVVDTEGQTHIFPGAVVESVRYESTVEGDHIFINHGRMTIKRNSVGAS